MLPSVSLPSDSNEVAFAVTGTPGATVQLAGKRLTGGGLTWWPLASTVVLDAAGAGSLTALCQTVGAGGTVGAGVTLTWAPSAPTDVDATGSTTAAAYVSTAGEFARHLATLLGTGMGNAPDGSNNAADFAGLGSALAGGRATNLAALAECFPDSADATLPEWETRLGLQQRPDLSDAVRQARCVAKVRAARAASPGGILSAVRVLASEATLTEVTAASAAATNPRHVFKYAVVINAAHWADAELRGVIEAVLAQMEPAHTHYTLTTRVGFRCNDPNSLTNRDVLGS